MQAQPSTQRFALRIVPCLPVAFCAFVFATELAAQFKAPWAESPDRRWVGAEFWANPLEDWRIHGGRLECVRGGANRNVHVLTHGVRNAGGSVRSSVAVSRLGQQGARGSAGFRIGIRSELGDHRSALIHGRGIDCGVRHDGTIFVGDAKGPRSEALAKLRQFGLELTIDDAEGARDRVVLVAKDAEGGELARASALIERARLAGNLALVNNFAEPRAGRQGGRRRGGRRNAPALPARHAFADWTIAGTRVASAPDRAWGPILWTQHTLSRGTLRLSAFLPPLGPNDDKTVTLEVRRGNEWQRVGSETLDTGSWTAVFEVRDWDASRNVPYRVRYALRSKGGKSRGDAFEGTIRKDPVEDRSLAVAGFTGNTDAAFPNAKLVDNISKHDPDLLFFSGDQLYEFCGGYGIKRNPVDLAILTYLRKYYLFGWAFRDLLRDRPSVILPDDHDVYQGNIWGNGGNAITIREHARGGFAMHEDFVNVVMRTQCAHMPRPYDPKPIQRGIDVAYTHLVYGRVSFAVIEDRKWKAGPKGLVESGSRRPDHVLDPKIDVKKLDVPEAALLGKRQLDFLEAWAQDWRGIDLKCVLSQTIFANVANYHGGNQQFIIADLDSNGWPQSGRRRALRAIRKGFGFMYAGDQHLASIVHHGIDAHRDAGVSFCVPSIAAGYPRSWRPDAEGRPVRGREAGGLANTGDYVDGLGNLITVHAVGNPAAKNRRPVLERLHDKASGYGLVHFDKQDRTIRMECWRLLFDAAQPKASDQFPGWPRTISMLDNYARKAAARLPELRVRGMNHPVVKVTNSKTNELVYALRIRGTKFRPKVFDAATRYDVQVGEPGTPRFRHLKDLSPGKGHIDIDFR